MSESLTLLRVQLTTWGVDAVYVPHDDEYLNEYLPADREALAWLSGFTGSAGAAIISADTAVLFVDGRYPIQARAQTDANHWTVLETPAMRPEHWIEGKNIKTLGVDISCLSTTRYETLRDSLAAKNITLKSIPTGAIFALMPKTHSKKRAITLWDSNAYEGRGMEEKLKLLRVKMREHHVDGAVIADPTMVSWLCGMRSHVIARIPQIIARAYIDFHNIYLEPYDKHNDLESIKDKIKIILDITTVFSGCVGYDPDVTSPAIIKDYKNVKKIKNLFEDIRCGKTPHSRRVIKDVLRRDNDILDNFFKWLTDYLKTNTAYEHEIAEMIAAARAKHPLYVEESFDAIVGFRENSAIIHYRPERGADKLVSGDGVLLIDCGGQYQDGTTDRTTTLLLGDVGDKARHVYQTVVAAHDALAAATFPIGTTGAELSAIPNKILWDEGFSCPHGIGHGVGQYLSVHEGPYGISPRATLALPEGLLVSNEPGVYFEGAFGVRHERLYFVEADDNKRGFLKFST